MSEGWVDGRWVKLKSGKKCVGDDCLNFSDIL